MSRKSWQQSEGRTPLFKSLRRAIKLAHWSNQPSSPPVDELVEMQRAALLTRRRLVKDSIKAGLFLGGVGLVNALEQSNAQSRIAPRIVIVGAGIAGLNAAYQLKQATYRAQVYEAAKRIGGRMYTVEDVLGAGLTTNLGGEFVDSNHLEIQSLAKEFGIELLDREAHSEAALRTSYFFDNRHYTELEIIQAFRPIAAKIQADYNSIGSSIVDFQHEANASALDRTSLAEYLEKIEATGWLGKLLSVAYQTEYGLDTDRQSALNLITLIGTDISQGFKLFGESNERYLIKGGSQVIVDELAKRLPGQIQLEHRLEAVKSKGNGFTLTFAKPNSPPVDVDADFVVMTIPFTILRTVDLQVDMPPVKVKAIKELGYGTNAKVVVGFTRRFWRDKGSSGEVYSDLGFQESWDNTQLQPGKQGGITFFSGGTPGLKVGIGTDIAQASRLMSGLEKVFPGISATRNGKVSRFDWNTYPLTLGSYSAYLPGQWTTIANSQIIPVGNMFFAGEHCSYSFQGYMNGGAETGKKAAQSLMAVLKHKAKV